MTELLGLADLRPTPIAKAGALFSRSGVYLLYRGQQVVYVGQSCNVLRRLGEHLSDTRKTFDSLAIVPCSTDSRLWLEALYIKHFQPLYNLVPKADKTTIRAGRARHRVTVDRAAEYAAVLQRRQGRSV